MGKLYYDDPLAAAYMARAFGVKYFEPPGIHCHTDKIDIHYHVNDELGKIDPLTLSPTYNEYVIHPDSYDIFQPKAGDYVLMGESPHLIAEIGIDSITCLFKTFDGLKGGMGCTMRSITRIMQRGNKEFIAPMKENEDD